MGRVLQFSDVHFGREHRHACAAALDFAHATPCDLVLMDPPYAAGLAEAALLTVADPAWLAPGALVSVEADRPLPPPAGLVLEAERRFGKAHITLLRRDG